MITRHNITSATTTVLLAKSASAPSGISKVQVSNHDDSDSVTVELWLDSSTTDYVLHKHIIPPLVTLVLDDLLNYDRATFDLKLTTSTDGQAGGATVGNETTVIIHHK